MTARSPILSIAGHDPSSGAGIVADCEAIRACGGDPLSLLTLSTAQTSDSLSAVFPADAATLRVQAEFLFSQLQPKAVKIGALPSEEVAAVVADLISPLGCPVVYDPVLIASSGAPLLLGDVSALDALISHATLLTPNYGELTSLTGAQDEATAVKLLHQKGVSAVLVTGGDEPGDEVHERLYVAGESACSFYHPRLPGRFHGTGCSLSSAIATYLAQGIELGEAISLARRRVFQWLQSAYSLGGQALIPNRTAAGSSPAI